MSQKTCSHCHIGSRPRSVISPHPIHACARGCLSVFFLLSLYFFLKSFFHLFLIPAMVPVENSMEDPLCNSSFGSMVSLDYVTPDTSRELPMESRAKVDPGSGKHSIYSQFPKDPNFGICLKTKITRASCRRRAGTVVSKAENLVI